MTINNITALLKKIAILGVMLTALLHTQTITAQRKVPGHWKLTPYETKSDSLTLAGTMLTKSMMGWKKVKEPIQIQVFSGEELIASDMFTEPAGSFQLMIPISKIETKTLKVTIRANYYAPIEIKELLPASTEIEVYTEKTTFREAKGIPNTRW